MTDANTSSERPETPAEACCFKCGTPTQTLRPDEGMMDGATAWCTSGNYGSRLVDGGKYGLEIHICDLCLLLARERVLQYEVGSQILGVSRNVYEAWDPPKVGPDVRRRVLVVWEDEHGRYCLADQDGGVTMWNVHETLQAVFDKLVEHDDFMRGACTASACKKRVLERSETDPKSGILIGYALELLDVLGARFPKGQFWCERSDNDAVITLTIIVWAGVRLTVNVCAVNSGQRVFFEIFDQYKPDAKFVIDSIQDAIAYIDAYGAPSDRTPADP